MTEERKTEFGWKVVTRSLRSILIWPRGRIQYGFGKWSKRVVSNGPLAVFKEKNQALLFSRSFGGPSATKIFPCFYIRSNHSGLWVGDDASTSPKEYPHGTMFADAVYLLEEDDV